MASLKRYRQTPDTSAGARFRDLPPRFKRQKSITDSNTIVTQTQKQTPKPKKMPQSDDLISDIFTDSFNADQIKDYDNKDKKISKKGVANRQNLTFDRNLAKRLTQPVVLSPMDNKLFPFSQNDEQDFSATNVMNPFSWQSQQPLPCLQYAYDTGISQIDSSSYNGVWYHTPNEPLHQTKDNIHENIGPMSNTYSDSVSQPIKDYSERDQRIIEMFKELERVADQKEKEENENGTDRKSLVSHHLRMLMCAIDKYTEGIDDDMDPGGRVDEAPATDGRPSPSISPSNGQTSTAMSASQSFVQPSRTVVSTMEGTQPVTSAYNVQNCHSHQTPVVTNSLQQVMCNVIPSVNGQKSSESLSKPWPPMAFSTVDMQPWDLWSSPSFNVLDVYSHLSKGQFNSSETADSTFALFDQLGMENDFISRTEDCLTRTPLYKR